MVSIPLLDRLIHPGLDHGQLVDILSCRTDLWTIEIDEIGHLSGHHRGGKTGLLKQMTFKRRG